MEPPDVDEPPRPPRWRTVATGAGLLGIVPLILLVILALRAPATLWGGVYLLGASLLVFGLTGARAWRRAPWLLAAGCGVLLAVAVARIVATSRSRSVAMVALPGPRGAHWLGALVDEQDASLMGLQALELLGAVPRDDARALGAAMAGSLRAMRAAEGEFPSPVLRTFLGLERPGDFDALVVESAGARVPPFGVVFLHGVMGSTAVQCWQFAQAVRDAGGVTVCPSSDPMPDWWRPAGESTARATLAYLRARGVSRVYLAGISRGGYGAALLAPALRAQIAGLVLISGAPEEYVETGLPTLVVHGRDDSWMSPAVAREYAAAQGNAGTYRELPTGHFMLLDRAAEVRAIVAGWLRAQNGN